MITGMNYRKEEEVLHKMTAFIKINSLWMTLKFTAKV
jgi:hypothetical protein